METLVALVVIYILYRLVKGAMSSGGTIKPASPPQNGNGFPSQALEDLDAEYMKALENEASISSQIQKNQYRKEASPHVSEPQSISRIGSTYEQRSPLAKANFIPAGESVTIQGHQIDSGMIYVGNLGEFPHWDTPRSHISFEAPVAKSNEDVSGDQMNYWPSYTSIPPQSRLAYLQWLAGGRRDPEYGIGYVFLFFYGLEYRLLKEQAFENADAIIKEVQELRKVYGHNHSFDRYTRVFLEAASIWQGAFQNKGKGLQAKLSYQPMEEPYRSYEIPLKLRAIIGGNIEQKGTITADLSLDWWIITRDRQLPKTVQRVFNELRTLFTLRFEAEHSEGLKIKLPKTRLKGQYQSASRDFQLNMSMDVPDIRNLKAPLKKIDKIAQACIEELKPFSRAMAKCDDGKPSLEAISVLPPDMLATVESETADTLRQWISQTATAQYSSVPVANVFEAVGIDYAGKPTAAKLRKVATILGCVGYDIEPHPDFGGQCRNDQNLILFSKSDNALTSASENYVGIAHTVSLSVAVANVDGVISSEEKQHLTELVAKEGRVLCDGEQNRLQAHLTWLLAHPPSWSSIQAKLKKLSVDNRRLMARFALATATADNHIAPSEVKFLEKFYNLIEVDKKQLYTDLHAFEHAPSDEPVSVKPAEAKTNYSIPQEEKVEQVTQSGVVLDLARIEEIRQETHQVSQILSDVFAEPEIEDTVEEVQEIEETETFDGLDGDHGQLLDELLAREEWAREEYERLCSEFGLMAEGAMETINDWAFDVHDDAMIEDGDPIVINKELLQGNAA